MSNTGSTSHHDDHITQALAVSGGHLFLGRGGFSLHFARGATLSGYSCEEIKSACIAAGLPVIDARHVDFDALITLVFQGPMVAVGHEADPQPWHSLSFAPLDVVAACYAHKGAEISNIAIADPSEAQLNSERLS